MLNSEILFNILPTEIANTLYMVFFSLIFSLLIGFMLGIASYFTANDKMKQNAIVHFILQGIINIGRSFPFAILIIALIPLTRWLVGTSLGNTAAIVPLALAAAPFFARVLEGILEEIDKGLIEAALLMNTSFSKLIFKVLLPEVLPGLVRGITLTTINLIGYSAIAGIMGAGGLGKIAIQYGYQRMDTFVMVVTVFLFIFLVTGVQAIGSFIAKKIEQKRGLR